jgi:hypothetical protein
MKSKVFLVELQFLGFRGFLDSDSSLKSRVSYDCNGLAFSISRMLSIVNDFSIVQYYAHYLYLVQIRVKENNSEKSIVKQGGRRRNEDLLFFCVTGTEGFMHRRFFRI